MHAASAMRKRTQLLFLHIPILLSEYTNLRTRESFFDFYEVIIIYSRDLDQIKKKKAKENVFEIF